MAKRNIELYFVFISFMFAPTITTKSRSVNLDLETSFLFEPADMKNNATILTDVHNVLDKLQAMFNPNMGISRRSNSQNYLTSFMTEIGTAMVNFEDKEVTNFVDALKDVVDKQIETSDFKRIIKDKRLKNFLKKSVAEYAATDPVKLKLEIAKYLTNNNVTYCVTFVRNLNKLFKDEDEAEFKNLLVKFNDGRKNKDFEKFIVKTIDFVVYKRYKKQSAFFKILCNHELKKLANYIGKNYKDMVRDGDEEKQTDEEVRRLWHATLKELTLKNDSGDPSESDKAEEIVINKDLQVDVRPAPV